VQRSAVRTDKVRLGDDPYRPGVALLDQATHRRVASHAAGEHERSSNAAVEPEQLPDVI